MLARLTITLDTDLWDYSKSPKLQGILMENIDSGYAEQLHQQGMHPYSQNLTFDGEHVLWQINTLTQEAFEQIVQPMVSCNDMIHLHHEAEPVRILERQIIKVHYKELMHEFYEKPAERSLRVNFLTPTAFRQNKRYVILPDIRLTCQSLMLKQSELKGDMDMLDQDALEQLASECVIARHKIKSVLFPAEGANIPGFVGSVDFRCFGTETMARYLRFLLSFAEFSGVGIKAGMGMGAVRMEKIVRGDR